MTLLLRFGEFVFGFGESRVICGYHWQSDVDAARIVGSAVVATLHTNPLISASTRAVAQPMEVCPDG
jgi:membrane-associated phospholipid phosphatase